jgi:threonine/homoserine efflux transporter RhtA
MNIKQRALIHTVLVIVGIIGLSLIINLIVGMMTPDQLGLAFAIAVVLLFAKIVYDYRLDQLTYEAKLAEMAEKNPK